MASNSARTCRGVLNLGLRPKSWTMSQNSQSKGQPLENWMAREW